MAEAMAKRARSLWLAPDPDMNKVETMYRSAISSFLAPNNKKRHNKKRKKQRMQDVSSAIIEEEWQILAMEQLCMILCQSGRSQEAKFYLEKLGYVCRLANCILDYSSTNNPKSKKKNNKKQKSSSFIACRIWDNFLTQHELEHLTKVFHDEKAHYWVHHKYQVEPPSPYFSYIVPLIRDDDHNNKEDTTTVSVDDKFGCFGDIITQLYQHLLPHFPKLANATMVEFWAHNRPHPTGHQFHFDSDNEGQGRVIKNPIMTAILYLSDSSAGGPSIITNQTLASTNMGTKSVMNGASQPGRLLAFDGKLLHGVIPGKCTHSGKRRVTLMLAFWKRIRVRPGDTPGAARPYPFSSNNDKNGDGKDDDNNWNRLLVLPSTDHNKKATQVESEKQQAKRPVPIPRNPISLDRVYETLDGEKWTKNMGMPEYDQVFQGF